MSLILGELAQHQANPMRTTYQGKRCVACTSWDERDVDDEGESKSWISEKG